MNKSDKEFIVQKIRTEYAEKESTQLAALIKLDKKVKKPALVFAYTFGSISAIILGSGMSLIMTDIGEIIGIIKPLISGIITGIAGLTFSVINYPIFKKILAHRRKKYAKEIIELSDKIMKDYIVT